MTQAFWLYKWIDEFEINDHTNLQVALSDERVLLRLQELAALETYESPSAYADVDNALVLGRDMDLSGDLDCCLDLSKKYQIDQNFGRLLHYFDKLIVAGPSANRYSRLLERPNEQALMGIATHIEALLWLRQIGADEIVEFKPKCPVSSRDYKKWARLCGIASVLDCRDALTDLFAKEGEFRRLRRAARHWHFSFRHPLLEHDIDIPLVQEKKPTRKQMTQAAFAHYAALLTSDVISAQMLKLPMGSNADLHASMLTGHKSESIVAETALNVYLPVLDGIPLRDIIRLRKDEHDYFVKFQSALSLSIKKQLEYCGEDPTRTAREVQKDIIDPALSDIYMRLTAVEKSLVKKVGLGVGIGSVLTMIGTMGSAPIVIGSGLAFAATALAAAQSYIEGKKDIRLSDMYFLWLLEQEYQNHQH